MLSVKVYGNGNVIYIALFTTTRVDQCALQKKKKSKTKVKKYINMQQKHKTRGWTTAMLFWLDFHQAQSNLYK